MTMNSTRKDEARRLRLETRMSLAQLRDHFGVSRDTLAEWLDGLPNPEWTVRPQAKDELRAEAVELRKGGCSVPDIARRLGVAKSTAFLWTRHLPLDPTPEHAEARVRRHMEHMREVRWEPHRRERDANRAAVNEREVAWVGALSDREVMLIGAVAYWCEGAKEKSWRKNDCALTFINSDERLILLFIRFVELLGVDRTLLHYRLSIHVSADVDAATRSWAEVVGIPPGAFQRPTLKKHNPKTVRYNVEETYRGCLMVYVPKSSRMYWKVEGIMAGVARSDGLEDGR
jgi:DNA-binding XRE family transcriptional regulator